MQNERFKGMQTREMQLSGIRVLNEELLSYLFLPKHLLSVGERLRFCRIPKVRYS